MSESISHLFKSRGIVVYTSPETPVRYAADLMAAHNVSSILVFENHRTLVGIFTERDLLRKVVALDLPVHHTPVQEVMTVKPVTVSASATPAEVFELMRNHHIRHIPVVDGDRVIGVISLRDIVEHDAKIAETPDSAID